MRGSSHIGSVGGCFVDVNGVGDDLRIEDEAETRVVGQDRTHHDRQTARTTPEETTAEVKAAAAGEARKTESRKDGAAR